MIQLYTVSATGIITAIFFLSDVLCRYLKDDFIINTGEPAAIHHKNTTSNFSSGSGSTHLRPVPLQVFLVGILPLAVFSGGGDFGRIICRTTVWCYAWLAAIGWWRWWDDCAFLISSKTIRARLDRKRTK